MRVDKWLWVARFYRSRNLARTAVQSGRVHRNGQRVKPAQVVGPGDVLRIGRGERQMEVEILALAARRGSASIAQTLYRETEESRAAADQKAASSKSTTQTGVGPSGRPDKHARRRLSRLKRGG